MTAAIANVVIGGAIGLFCLVQIRGILRKWNKRRKGDPEAFTCSGNCSDCRSKNCH